MFVSVSVPVLLLNVSVGKREGETGRGAISGAVLTQLESFSGLFGRRGAVTELKRAAHEAVNGTKPRSTKTHKDRGECDVAAVACFKPSHHEMLTLNQQL